ncbi:hypothetical protein SK128_022097, partial [Halocaridina rubra]
VIWKRANKILLRGKYSWRHVEEENHLSMVRGKVLMDNVGEEKSTLMGREIFC